MIPPPFPRTYHFLVLGQDEVVVTEGHAENNRRHAFEAVDPLLPLRPLATNIKHPGEAEEPSQKLWRPPCPATTPFRGDGGASTDCHTSRVQGRTRTRLPPARRPLRALLFPAEGSLRPEFFSLERFQQEDLELHRYPAESPGHAWFVLSPIASATSHLLDWPPSSYSQSALPVN